MAEITYKKEQDMRNIEKIREHISSMPEFTNSFFTFYLSIKNASTRTVLNYAYDIETFFYFLQTHNPSAKSGVTLDLIDNLSPLDIQEYVDFLTLYEKDGIKYSNSEPGKARKLASLRSFYKYYQNMKLIKNNPASLVPSPKQHKKNIIKLENDEVEKVITAAHSGEALTGNQLRYAAKSHYRDIAILTLLLGTGIRVSECVGINLKDINWDKKSIKIIRKGGDEAFVYFNKEVEDALNDYLDLERHVNKSNDDNALFISRKHERITPRSVERIVKKYTQNIITDKKITPHKLRSTYGTNLYRESGDIYLTADALGHKNIAVTAEHYADIGDEKRKTAAEFTNKWLN